jgi:hypothetical protein
MLSSLALGTLVLKLCGCLGGRWIVATRCEDDIISVKSETLCCGLQVFRLLDSPTFSSHSQRDLSSDLHLADASCLLFDWTWTFHLANIETSKHHMT